MNQGKNGILLVHKEEEYTSFDVIAKLRGVLHTRKMGHAGTLDPMATGVLPVFLGEGTKAIPYLENHDKRYKATFALGFTTDTQDKTGTISSKAEVKVNKEDVEKALSNFRGKISQLPPMYSAVKVDGRRLYDLARQGEEVERAPREVEIYSLTLLEEEEQTHTYTIDVRCSKGTYIRTLCHDLGQDLGCGATLIALCRTEACGYALEDCKTIAEIEKAEKAGDENLLLPIDTAFVTYPKATLSPEDSNRFVNGQKMPPERFCFMGEISPKQEEKFAVYTQEDLFLGMAFCREDGLVKPERIFFRNQ